jgi:O-antigen ligase
MRRRLNDTTWNRGPLATLLNADARPIRPVVPVALAAASLALVALVGAAPFTGFRTYLVLAMVGGLGLTVVLQRFALGVAILPLVAAAVPFSLGTGTQSPIVAGLMFAVMLLGLWVVRAVVARDFRIVDSPINLPVVTLSVVWIIAFAWSDVIHSPLVWTWNDFILPRLGQLGIVVVSSGVLLLGLNAGRDLRFVKIATWSLIGLSVIPVLAFYGGMPNAVAFISTGGLFTGWVVALAYGQALFNEKLPTWLRGGLVLLVMAWLVKATLFQTIWFSGWVPALVAVAIITLWRSRRVFVALLLIAAIAVATNYGTVLHAVYQQKVEEGDLTRVGIWDQALNVFQQNPLLGTGPAGYAAYNMSIYRGSQFSLSTHSNYLDVVIETGVVGTLAFAWFLLTMAYLGWRARTSWTSGFAGGYANGAFGAFLGVIVAMGLGDWLIPFVYNQTIAGFRYTVHSWLFLGFLASLAARRPVSEDV